MWGTVGDFMALHAVNPESFERKRLTVAGRVARIDFAPKWEVDANEAPHSGSR